MPQALQTLHHGRLAGAVRPQETEDGALGYLQIKVFDGDDVTESLGQAFSSYRRSHL